MTNTGIQHYIERFQDIYNGAPWYGETIDVKLKDISDLIAFIQPHDGAHSIAELVKHMTYWRQSLIKRLEGDEAFKGSMKSPDNWISVDSLSAMGWQKIRDEFDEAQHKIIQLLSKQNDDLLTQEYSKGKTFEYLIEGIIDHDVYHLGQIGLVKKMIEG